MNIVHNCVYGRLITVNFNLRFYSDGANDIISFEKCEICIKIHIKDCETNSEYTSSHSHYLLLKGITSINLQKISKSCVDIVIDTVFEYVNNYCCRYKYFDSIKNIGKMFESLSKSLSNLIKQNLLINEYNSDR